MSSLRFQRPTRRLIQLYVGLSLYGVSMACLVRSSLGVIPWDVLHQGIARKLGLSLGTVVIIVGALVLLAWIPLRQRPGLGTISNVAVLGVSVDVSLRFLPVPALLGEQIAYVIGGILLNAFATAAYIGVQLGPGPRDGLMTGIARRTGWPIWAVRTSIEVSVVIVGWLIGGTLGLATLAYALLIGPLVQPLMPRLRVPLPEARRVAAPSDSRGRPSQRHRSGDGGDQWLD